MQIRRSSRRQCLGGRLERPHFGEPFYSLNDGVSVSFDCLFQVTGGGDGATRLWNEHHIHESPIHQLRIDDDDHTPCQVAITPAGYVAVSRLGTLYLRQQGRWCAMYENELLGSGCVADSDGERLIFGTKAGSVFLFAANGSGLLLEKMHQLERSKIYSVHLVGRQQFIACFDQGKLLLMDSLSSGSPSSRYVLPEAKQRWPSCVLATRHHLIIGDRDGSLHLYSKQSEVIGPWQNS